MSALPRLTSRQAHLIKTRTQSTRIFSHNYTRAFSSLQASAKQAVSQPSRARSIQSRTMSSESQSTAQAQWITSAQKPYEHILTSTPAPGVALITLNRPKALNALCSPLIFELNDALERIERDDETKAIVITGSEKAFAAGADIKEMKNKSYQSVVKHDFLADWHKVANVSKPTIAAVSGYALGGGCELALMCDILFASPTAVFGQPEIDLGVIPGAGGTQRLTRAIGKSRAMEVILTGRRFTADEAAAWGVASRVVPDVVDEAVKVASKIASKGAFAARAAKESVKRACEVGQEEGLVFERRLFHGLFATNDQKEGMASFVEKRIAKFTDY